MLPGSFKKLYIMNTAASFLIQITLFPHSYWLFCHAALLPVKRLQLAIHNIIIPNIVAVEIVTLQQKNEILEGRSLLKSTMSSGHGSVL